MSKFGILVIKPISAKIKRVFETNRGLDPFCKSILGDTTKVTGIHYAGGKFPSWDDILVMPRTDENVLVIELWDCDFVKGHKLIGTAGISLLSMFGEPKSVKMYPLYINNKQTGEILIDIEWIPSERKFSDEGIGTDKEDINYSTDIVDDYIEDWRTPGSPKA
jgi:Ca2+-dependent lipid-binding protein